MMSFSLWDTSTLGAECSVEKGGSSPRFCSPLGISCFPWTGTKGNCGLSIFIHATLNMESQSGVEKAKALVAAFLSVPVSADSYSLYHQGSYHLTELGRGGRRWVLLQIPQTWVVLTEFYKIFFFGGNNSFIYFTYFWLCWVYIAVQRLSLVAMCRGYYHCGAQTSHCSGFSCCRSWVLGSQASITLLQEGDPFQGPKLGFCLTLGNELSEETHVLTKHEILLWKGAWGESSRVRESRRTALPCGSQSQVLWWWD